MLDQILKKKDYLPVLHMQDDTPVTQENWQQRRQEMLQLLTQYSYGRTPLLPDYLECKVESIHPDEYAGKVIEEHIQIGFRCSRGFFAFPITLYIPKKTKQPPVFLHLAFRPAPDPYIPVASGRIRLLSGPLPHLRPALLSYFGISSPGCGRDTCAPCVRRTGRVFG